MNLQPTDGNEKAVTPVIGFILVFLLVMILFSMYNTTIIPQQDSQQEIEHSQQIRDSMSNLRQNILAASEGVTRSTTLKLGVEYGGVSFTGVHSAPTSGTIQVTDYNGVQSQFTIENAVGVGGTTDKLWNGGTRSYNTHYIVYYSDYNYYTRSPNLYIDSTVLYSDFTQGINRTVLESDQSLVNGNKISLTTITGNVTTSQVGQISMQVEPVSASKDTITISSENATNPLTIQFPSQLDAEHWRTILKEQTNENGGHITGITEVNSNNQYGTHTIQLTFETSETYQLAMSRLQVQPETTTDQQTNIKPAYVDWKGNDSTAVIQGSRKTIPATVRDRYNNPVPGVLVDATVTETTTNDCIGSFTSGTETCIGPNGNSYSQPGVKISNSEGQVTFVYEAPEETRTQYTGNFELSINNTEETAR